MLKNLQITRAREAAKQAAETPPLEPFAALNDDLLAIADEEGVFIYMNDAAQNLFQSAAKKEPVKLSGILHPEDRKAFLEGLRSEIYARAAQPIKLEARVISAQNQILDMRWHFQVEGNYLYCAGRDIGSETTQQNMNALHEAQLAEMESIGRLGRWRWDVGQDTFDFSDRLYEIFGQSPESFTPTFDSIAAKLPREDGQRLSQALQRAMISQTPYEIDFRVLKNGGEITHIRCQGRCALNANGEVTALYGIMQDVTEIMLHEEALRRAKESAERAYASKTQFLANMSHELRTPLNAIIGFSEMMERQLLGPIGTEKYLDYISGIRESGEHLLDLISDILDMSKIEAGKYTLHLEELNIAKLIRMAVHMMEGRALEGDIKIEPVFDNEELVIAADRRAMLQMILNLLSNAVKFSHQGGKVTISCLERETYYSIKIKDEGVGIPAHKLADVLNPFEQAESHYSREHEGTGLGLAITKDLAELHGGALYIESVVGQGTNVTIRMPYDAAQKHAEINNT